MLRHGRRVVVQVVDAQLGVRQERLARLVGETGPGDDDRLEGRQGGQLLGGWLAVDQHRDPRGVGFLGDAQLHVVSERLAQAARVLAFLQLGVVDVEGRHRGREPLRRVGAREGTGS